MQHWEFKLICDLLTVSSVSFHGRSACFTHGAYAVLHSLLDKRVKISYFSMSVFLKHRYVLE